MKKIAIIFRGPIRPDIETVNQNIKLLKSNLRNFEIETYLFTWNTPVLSFFITNGGIDNVVAIKEPSVEFIKEILTTRTKQNSFFDRNYKAFWSVLNSIKLVLSTNIKYDWIILTRTDLSISLSNIKDWLDEDFYIMPTQENFIINDQFGIAKPEIMLNAWNYKDLPTLNKLYSESFNPEECLKKIMEMNKVSYKKRTAQHYQLNSQRHSTDKEYLKNCSKRERKEKLFQTFKKILEAIFPSYIYAKIKLIYKKWKK